MEVTEVHEVKRTLRVDVLIPGHQPRGCASPLFERTRQALIEREGGRCWLSGLTAEELGAPLEAHHYPIERCYAEGVDWQRFARDAKAGHWGVYAQAFDWGKFFEGATTKTIEVPEEVIPASCHGPGFTIPAHTISYLVPVDPYVFVDNMLFNGRLLGLQFHTGADAGVHEVPEPEWLAQKFLIEGYKFSPTEVIHHGQE